MKRKKEVEIDIKSNLATNIARYRKALKLTQVDLARELNYSDKAVSKWERGESVPDLTTLKRIADYFEVKIDTLLQPPKDDLPFLFKTINKKRLLICLSIVALVWLVSTCAFAFIDIIFPTMTHTWLFFVYALPVSLAIIIIFTSVWGKRLINMIIISILIWSTLSSVYISLVFFLPHPIPPALWEIFLIGLPFQCVTIFGFLYKKADKTNK